MSAKCLIAFSYLFLHHNNYYKLIFCFKNMDSKVEAIKYLEKLNARQVSYRPRETVDSLNSFYESGELTDPEIENALEKAARKIGREQFNMAIKLKKYADDTSAKYLAYALKKGEFSKKEKKKLLLDGETLEEFIETSYRENLLTDMKEEIFSYSEPPINLNDSCCH